MPHKDPAARRAYRLARKDIANALRRANYAANPEPHRAEERARRIANPEKIHAQDRARSVRRKVQQSAYMKTRYQRKREELLAKNAVWRAENQELLAASGQTYYMANRPTILAKSKVYRTTHLLEILSRNARRRAREKNAPLNDLTHAQWLEIQTAQNHRCYYCGKRRKGKLTRDHLTPLSKGGAHTLHNVIAVCGSCNSRKGTRPAPMLVQPLLLTVAPKRKPRASESLSSYASSYLFLNN